VVAAELREGRGTGVRASLLRLPYRGRTGGERSRLLDLRQHLEGPDGHPRQGLRLLDAAVRRPPAHPRGASDAPRVARLQGAEQLTANVGPSVTRRRLERPAPPRPSAGAGCRARGTRPSPR